MPQLTMPNVGEGITEGTVTRWLKREGDRVALDEPVVEIETDKAIAEIPSPFEGVLTNILVPEGAVVPIGAPLAEFDGAPASAPAAPPERATVDASNGAAATRNGARSAATVGGEHRRARQYSPVVLRLAAEHDIDLSLVRGSGIDGRVTRQDVLRYVENPSAHTVAPGAGEGVVGFEKQRGPAPPAPRAAVPSGTAVPLTPTRRTIAQRMSESHRTIPVAWMVVEADVTGLVALRERAKEQFERVEGANLTYMPFFVQAIVGALKEHPALNATFTDDGIVRHASSDIGVAVATDWGLVVPVVRDAGGKSVAGLARELRVLGDKARARKLSVEEMRGATFTIDNTGAFGSILSQPIVPVGQVAIITTEAIRRELRPLVDGAFGVRAVMNLCVSFDHRALDGAEAGAFMQGVKRRLEAYAADQQVY